MIAPARRILLAAWLLASVAAAANVPGSPDDNSLPAPEAVPWSETTQAWIDARTDLPPAPHAERVGALARALAAAPEFGTDREEPRWHWQWRFEPQERKAASEGPGWLKKALAFLQGLSPALGTAGHVLLWLLLLALLVLVWHRRHALLALLPRPATRTETVGGIDILPLLSPDALPADVTDAARRLWATGHARDALALLYRASLHRLGDRLEFAVPASGTEQECLRLVRARADADTAAAFQRLVNDWIRCAWADRLPDDLAPRIDDFERIARAAAAAPAGAEAHA